MPRKKLPEPAIAPPEHQRLGETSTHVYYLALAIKDIRHQIGVLEHLNTNNLRAYPEHFLRAKLAVDSAENELALLERSLP